MTKPSWLKIKTQSSPELEELENLIKEKNVFNRVTKV